MKRTRFGMEALMDEIERSMLTPEKERRLRSLMKTANNNGIQLKKVIKNKDSRRDHIIRARDRLTGSIENIDNYISDLTLPRTLFNEIRSLKSELNGYLEKAEEEYIRRDYVFGKTKFGGQMISMIRPSMARPTQRSQTRWIDDREDDELERIIESNRLQRERYANMMLEHHTRQENQEKTLNRRKYHITYPKRKN